MISYHNENATETVIRTNRLVPWLLEQKFVITSLPTKTTKSPKSVFLIIKSE